MLMHTTDWPRTNRPVVRYECANVCTCLQSQKIQKILSTMQSLRKFIEGQRH